MIAPLTPNTQAILLLTAPLIAGRSDASPELLTLGEYNRLARLLRERQKQPADLIGPDATEAIALVAAAFGRPRLESLLGRGFLLSQAIDRWGARAIWVVSRADGTYPQRIKTRLKEAAPPVLYGCGEACLLDTGGLAIVGSRHVDEELIGYTENVGRLAAESRRTVVSGGAKGIDRAAMRGALQAGGTQRHAGRPPRRRGLAYPGVRNYADSGMSGESFSMVFFAQKVLRKMAGNWTFVVVTDRVELDDQIAKTFKATGAVSEAEGEGDQCHAASGAHLRELLRGNHRYVFTLIHKFRPDTLLNCRSRGDETHYSPAENQTLLT